MKGPEGPGRPRAPPAREVQHSGEGRVGQATGHDSLAQPGGPSLRERLRQVITDAGMWAPERFELGKLYPFPGAARTTHAVSRCLLLDARPLDDDLDPGLVLEVGRRKVRRSRIGDIR